MCMERFVVAIRGCFEVIYLRQPTKDDIEKQMSINEKRGFPGMFGSLDCMHWVWKNLSSGLAGSVPRQGQEHEYHP